MLVDLHVHTRRYSGCSSIEPEDLLERALEIGLDGIALTEHGILWPSGPLEELRRTAGRRLRILVGQEVACYSREGRFEGELLVFGVDRALGSNSSAAELISTVRTVGGIVIAAHPYKPSRTGVGYYGLGNALSCYDVDAIELGHPDHDGRSIIEGARLSVVGNIPATGGSDAHSLSALGAYATLCLRDVACEKDLAAAVRQGLVVPVARKDGRYVPL